MFLFWFLYFSLFWSHLKVFWTNINIISSITKVFLSLAMELLMIYFLRWFLMGILIFLFLLFSLLLLCSSIFFLLNIFHGLIRNDKQDSFLQVLCSYNIPPKSFLKVAPQVVQQNLRHQDLHDNHVLCDEEIFKYFKSSL